MKDTPKKQGAGGNDEAVSAASARLSQSLVLEEQSPGGLLRATSLFIIVFAVAFMVWAAHAQISEVVVSSGEVSPAGSVKRVQHLEGGIVEEIMVKDGSLVEQGDVFMALAASSTAPQRDQLLIRLKGLEFEAEQLSAISTGKPVDLEEKAVGRYGQLSNSQLMVFHAKQLATKAQGEVIEKQIAQKRAERELLRKTRAWIIRQVKIIDEQLDIRKSLLKKGLQPKLVMLDNERELARTQGQLVENEVMQKVLLEAISELYSRITEINTRLAMEAAENLGKIHSEIAELRESIGQAEERVSRLHIRAPVKGLIQNLRTETLGGVIAPGDTVAEVIPTGAELIVEARIDTKDIGFIYKGQKADVKVVTFDYTRYGAIIGAIDHISATTLEDETGTPHYLAYIKLEKNHVGDNPELNLVVPGMTVTADIRTGRKSLAEYLLKPIYKAFVEAFRER